MSTIEKLIARFTNKPRDFSWQELIRLLNHFGYIEITGSGSKRKFVHTQYATIRLHEPHPRSILKKYQIDQIYAALKEEKLI
jgi:predicted RNA binding protein YcfA (HicA-like mRNA interferase family)